ncbi:hypothetical protein [Vibrio alginolyticus]|uniref:hypothetical protein n=1 Tax=Vibrio alginolyticus TaxID=663 RepID=UPI00215C2221|nr:hypothetical protein [Vibrio alginolyticus]ELH9640318.1 hypothetical protein [Vibrio alginolyticus]MCR9397247.1 hypothetical protein [Vibrio alginolyticus]
MIVNIKQSLPNELQEYINHCEEQLLNSEPVEFVYPAELVGKDVSDPIWDDLIEEVKEPNEKEILSKLRHKANIYAIFTKNGDEPWVKKYVGERKAIDMRQRITSHLINKNRKTGSKLDLVRDAVSKGQKIGLRFIFVPRDTMRAFVEEEIISKYKAELVWNKHR